MRAGHFLANGMRWKFNVLLAKEAGHFEKIGFAQRGFLLTVRARDFLTKIASRKGDVSAAMDTESF